MTTFEIFVLCGMAAVVLALIQIDASLRRLVARAEIPTPDERAEDEAHEAMVESLTTRPHGPV